jgi:enoyl-CoA hydratase/carnithine racemase
VGELRSDLEDGVLTITIDRPASCNTITYPVLDAFLDVFERVERDTLNALA